MQKIITRFFIATCLLLNLEQISQATSTGIIKEYMTPKSEQKQIKLFVYKTCPFCLKVINYLIKIGQLNNVLIFDVAVPEHMAELKRLNNGDTQCPFLADEPKNIQMLESADIIAYLSSRF